MLANEYVEHEQELRADLQQTYNVDIDHAIAGAHSAYHIACLVAQLPIDARIRVTHDADCRWTLDNVLLARLCNSFSMFVYGMSDKKKRGAPPKLIGPSCMTNNQQMRTLPARVLPVSELIEILNKPRG